MTNQDTDRVLTLGQVLVALRRSWWIVLVGLIAGGAGGYALARTTPKRYTATSSVLFNTSPVIDQLTGATPGSAAPTQGQQDTDVMLVRLGTTRVPAARTARSVGHGLTRSAVADSLTIAPESDTQIVSVAATSASATRASQIANTYVHEFILEQRRTARNAYRSALAAVDGQLASMTPAAQSTAAGLELQQRAQSLATIAQVDNGAVQVAAAAMVPTSPSSPDTKLEVVLGVIVGLAVALGLVALRERFNRRIRTVGELEAIFGKPVLGAIPEDAGVAIRPAIPGESAWSEAFARLRTRLRYFNVDHDLQLLVVTSASPGEGTSTVAYNLAVAATRAGASTLLIEADLRHPALASRLGLEADPGLGSALVRGCPFEETIRSMALRSDRDGRLGGLLDVIPAGSVPPPNPGELLESRALGTLLAKARDAYGLIIVDTPALGAVSDAMPLLALADGVVVVSDRRGGRTDVARGVRTTLEGLHVPVLGVVANRVRGRATATYGPSPHAAGADPQRRSMNGHAPAIGAGVGVDAGEEGWE